MFLVLLLLLLLRGYSRSHGCLLSSIQYMLPLSSSLTKPAAIMYRYVSKSLSLKHFVFFFLFFFFFSFTQFVRSFVRSLVVGSKAKQHSTRSTRLLF